MANPVYPRARSRDLVVQEMTDETLIYDLIANEAHCLNKTAAFVWSRCSGIASVSDIAKSIEVRFGHPVDLDFVRLAISQLNDRRLLSEGGLNGAALTSRREAIRKIGQASVIAIPMIASIVAPPNALGSISCACTNPASCLSQAGNSCPPQAFSCNALGICVVGP